MLPMNTSLTPTSLIRIAKDDLDSAKELYRLGKYRACYVHFQQASEKASKALLLASGQLLPKDLKKAGHWQLDMYKTIFHKQKQELTTFFSKLENESALKALAGHYSFNFPKSVQLFDDVMKPYFSGQHDILKITGVELNRIIRFLDDLIDHLEEFDELADVNTNDISAEFARWIAVQFGLPEFEKTIQEIYSDPVQKAQLQKVFDVILDTIIPLSFVMPVFFMCSLITDGYHSKARYPENGVDPTKLFTARQPLIKRLDFFMEILGVALKEFEKWMQMIETPATFEVKAKAT